MRIARALYSSALCLVFAIGLLPFAGEASAQSPAKIYKNKQLRFRVRRRANTLVVIGDHLMYRIFITLAVVVCSTLMLITESTLAQNQWNTFRDNSLKFRFLYPSDWTKGTPRGANVKASLFSPQGFPSANCNIVVRTVPEFAGMTQQQLNKEIIRGGPFSVADWKEMLGGKWPEMTLIDSKIVKADNQPAYFGVVELCHETVDRKTFMKDKLLMTFTPGHMWILTCSAKGATNEESRVSFEHWQSTFQRIMGSLVFERW